MPRLMVLLLVLALAPSSSLAESVEYWIIVSGDRDESKAKQMLEAHKRTWPDDVVPREPFPKLVQSDRISGLAPGYTITVAGGCKDRKRAEKVRAALAHTFRGTYVRKVTAYYYSPSTCPQLVGGHSPRLPEGFTLDGTAPVDESKRLQWRVYLKPHPRPCDGNAVLVRLVDGKGKVLDEHLQEGQCAPGNGDLGSQTAWEYRFVTKENTRIEMVATTWAFDTPTKSGVVLTAEDARIAAEDFDPFSSPP